MEVQCSHVVQEKNDSNVLQFLEEAATVSSFSIFSDSPYLSSKVSNRVVEYGIGKIGKFGTRIVPCTQPEVISHGEIELGRLLGQGAFSSVFDVLSLDSVPKRRVDAEKVVVKVLKPDAASDARMFAACAADLVKEGLILSSLDHKNIVNIQALSCGGMTAYRNGRHDAFFIVMDKLNYTLIDRIKCWKNEKKNLPLFPSASKHVKKGTILQEKVDIILQLADALKYIHSKGMIHRDVKPDNIGFNGEGILKVFDFDVSRILPEESSSNDPDETFKLTRRVGSPRYMSPECGIGREYNAKVDVYAFALVCHEILTLKKPYMDLPSESHDIAVFIQGERPSIPSTWTVGLKNAVGRCWSPKAKLRPTMAEAHEILKQELPHFMNQKLGTSMPWSSFSRSAKAATTTTTQPQ